MFRCTVRRSIIHTSDRYWDDGKQKPSSSAQSANIIKMNFWVWLEGFCLAAQAIAAKLIY